LNVIVNECIQKEIQNFEAEKGHKPKSDYDGGLIELRARRRTQTRLLGEMGLRDEEINLARSSFIQRDVLLRAMEEKGIPLGSASLAIETFIEQLDFLENKLATGELAEIRVSLPDSDLKRTRSMATDLQSKMEELMPEMDPTHESFIDLKRQESSAIQKTNEAVLGILFGGYDNLAALERAVVQSEKIFKRKIRKI